MLVPETASMNGPRQAFARQVPVRARPTIVSEIMTAPVRTIDSQASVREAAERMRSDGLRHVVVVDEQGRVVGVVSDRDIRAAQPSLLLVRDPTMRDNALSLLKVGDLMKRNPHHVRPNHTIRTALTLMRKHKVGSLPVVDDEQRAVGILTGFDVLELALKLLAE